MFEALYRLLTGADEPDAVERSTPAFALAVLLIEVARSDDLVAEQERSVIARMLARRFDLSSDDVAKLLAAARQSALHATDLYRFTRVVVENFTEAERVAVIEMLWEVAYSDGMLSGDEDALIRRVAGLIYVPDHDRGDAKLRVRERLAGST
jgi:uncharacterized tellurite resistance protein B-like protein